MPLPTPYPKGKPQESGHSPVVTALCFSLLSVSPSFQLWSHLSFIALYSRNIMEFWPGNTSLTFLHRRQFIINILFNNSHGEVKIYDAWLTICFPNYALLVNWWVIRGILTLQATKSLFFGYSLLERHPVFMTSISHYLVF